MWRFYLDFAFDLFTFSAVLARVAQISERPKKLRNQNKVVGSLEIHSQN